MCQHICLLTLVFMCIDRKVLSEHWEFKKGCYSALFLYRSVAKSSERHHFLDWDDNICSICMTFVFSCWLQTQIWSFTFTFLRSCGNLLLCLQKAYKQLEQNKICWHALKLTGDQDGKVNAHSVCISKFTHTLQILLCQIH